MKQQANRQDKVRKALIREVSDIIATELKTPELQGELISVTDVELTQDLRYARVYLSFFTDDPVRQSSLLACLQTHQPRIRQLVGQRIRLRFTPEVVLLADDSLARGSRISKLLDDIAKGNV